MKKGFTLIELLIVISIIGILVTFAYPSYRDYITRARRAEGQTALANLSSRMERYYSEQQTYLGATLEKVGMSATTPQNWYSLQITHVDAASYDLQAVPNHEQAVSDKRCQTLTLNSLGLKGITAGPLGAPTGSAVECW